MVILVTYSIKYFTMEAVSLVCVLALDLTSGTMWLRLLHSIELIDETFHSRSIAELWIATIDFQQQYV